MMASQRLLISWDPTVAVRSVYKPRLDRKFRSCEDLQQQQQQQSDQLRESM